MQEFSSLRDKYMEGSVLLIDKEIHWTSFDVVGKIRSLLNRELKIRKIKVGHSGTLDPLASGLVIVCTGKYTKRIPEFIDLEKEYIAVIELGRSTPSFDMETDYDNTYPIDHITRDLVLTQLEKFRGKQLQTPPVYSAKNIGGSRAYEYARKGRKIKLEPVEIEIKEIELLDFALPHLKIRVLCSKGTYIRVLAHDLGKALDSGGHLVGLVRTAIGPYRLEDAEKINEFEENLKKSKQNGFFYV